MPDPFEKYVVKPDPFKRFEKAKPDDERPADVKSGPSGPDWRVAPQLGAMAGGLGGFALGGPIGAIAGAALGGGAGGFLRGYNDPEIPADAPTGERVSGGLMGALVDAPVQALMESGGIGAGRLLTKLAPKLMEQPLNRSAQQRLDFPNTPQRLVDMRMLPKVKPIEKALTETEQTLDATVRGFDAQRPSVKGFLGPAKQPVNLGQPPVPTGGRPGVTRAASYNPELEAMGPAGYKAHRRVFPVSEMFPETKVFTGQPIGGAVADKVQGPGTILRPMDAAPGGGAPPTMIDPRKLARSAHDFATTEGKLGGLGKVPGAEHQELDDLTSEYLRTNPEPLSLADAIQQKRAFQARSRYNPRVNAPTQTSGEINFNKGIAGANRSEAIRLQPELEGLLSKEQDLVGGLDAAQMAAAKPFSFSPIGLGKAAIGLRSPTLAGGAAIGLDKLGRTMPVAPSMMRLLLMSQMDGNGGEQ